MDQHMVVVTKHTCMTMWLRLLPYMGIYTYDPVCSIAVLYFVPLREWLGEVEKEVFMVGFPLAVEHPYTSQ